MKWGLSFNWSRWIGSVLGLLEWAIGPCGPRDVKFVTIDHIVL